jgi:hypothetical protein
MDKFITSVDTLFSSRQISPRLYYGLKNLDIDDIRELEGVGMKTLRMARGWGKGMVGEMAALAEKAGVAI